MADGPPRWLDRVACAKYISVRVDELPRLLKRGLIPAPSYYLGPRTPRWDREQIDALFLGRTTDSSRQRHDRLMQDMIDGIMADGRPKRRKAVD